MHLISRGLTFLVGFTPDGRLKCTVRLHKTQTQEPVIVFPCLSYPNGDRLRQAMPEGYQSLSALPGKGLLVRMGLEHSLRFPPAWPCAKSELVWTRAPTMMYPRSRRRPIIFLRLLLCTSQLELPECVTIQNTVISFQTAVPWRFWKAMAPWKADSFKCSLLQHRSLHSARCFFFFFSYKQQCFAAFLAVGVALKALPACPSVCCLSLFRLRASLSSLFTISVQKCHSPLSWAFTHTYTKHAHKWQPLKPPIKGQWQWGFCLCYKLELLQMLWQVCFTKMYCLCD